MARKARKTEDDEALLLFLPEQASPLAADSAPPPAESSEPAEVQFALEPRIAPAPRDLDLHRHHHPPPHRDDAWLDRPKWDLHPAPPFPPPPARRRPVVLPWVLVGFALGAVLWINRDIFTTIRLAAPRALSLADIGNRSTPLPAPPTAAPQASVPQSMMPATSVRNGNDAQPPASNDRPSDAKTTDSGATASAVVDPELDESARPSAKTTREDTPTAPGRRTPAAPRPRTNPSADTRAAATPPPRSLPPATSRPPAEPSPPPTVSGRAAAPAPVPAGTTGSTPAGTTGVTSTSTASGSALPPSASSAETSRVPRVAPPATPRPAAPAAAAPSTARAAAAAAIPETAPATQAAESAVLNAVRRYEAAYDRLDARAAAAVWPSVDERALRRAFSGLESQGLTLDRCDVRVESVSATAQCQGSISYVGRVGGSRSETVQQEWTFRMRKAGNDWLIDEVVAVQIPR